MNSEARLFDSQGNRKYLNRLERAAYFREVSRNRDLAERVFCLTLFYTGCRISEGLNLTPERIDLAGDTIIFETMKRRGRGYFRSVPIPPDLARLLKRLINRKPSARVWTFSRTTGFRIVKRHIAQAGITGAMACPKGLRHGFAVACVINNVPLTTVQKWLGHARLETTAIYLDAKGDEEREFAKRVWSNV